jgi:hypothetical protein
VGVGGCRGTKASQAATRTLSSPPPQSAQPTNICYELRRLHQTHARQLQQCSTAHRVVADHTRYHPPPRTPRPLSKRSRGVGGAAEATWPTRPPPASPPATLPEPTSHAPASTAAPWPSPLPERREEGAVEAPWPPRLGPTPSRPRVAL